LSLKKVKRKEEWIRRRGGEGSRRRTEEAGK
jgi:hypothetical protein